MMEADMNSSPYDWEMFYLEPDMDFSRLVAKLREKNWDVVMVGSMTSLIPSYRHEDFTLS
jgi:hypothetical protein